MMRKAPCSGRRHPKITALPTATEKTQPSRSAARPKCTRKPRTFAPARGLRETLHIEALGGFGAFHLLLESGKLFLRLLESRPQLGDRGLEIVSPGNRGPRKGRISEVINVSNATSSLFGIYLLIQIIGKTLEINYHCFDLSDLGTLVFKLEAMNGPAA